MPKLKKKPQSNVIVIATEWVAIDKLNHFHRNPRKADVEKIAESLKSHGQYKPVVVNKGSITGRANEILAGNHTVKAAKSNGWKEIWVSWVDVDESKGNQIVLADNGSTDNASYDTDVLADLLKTVQEDEKTLVGTTYDADQLNTLLGVTNQDENAMVGSIEEASDHLSGVDNLSDDVWFESDLDYDIPALLPEMVPEECPEPLDVWAGHELDGKDVREDYAETNWLQMWHAGSIGINWKKAIPFYWTDDFHFDGVFQEPSKNTKKILNLGISTCVMPNYTAYEEMPVSLWIYAIYRSAYVARYFQEAGLQVIPDIQTGNSDAILDISLLSIPQNCGVVAAQCQMSKGDKSFIRRDARLLKEAEDRLNFKSIIIYGHKTADEVVEHAGFNCPVIRVQNRTARRRDYLNGVSTINMNKGTRKKKSKK